MTKCEQQHEMISNRIKTSLPHGKKDRITGFGGAVKASI
jgi:hypothetical protein